MPHRTRTLFALAAAVVAVPGCQLLKKSSTTPEEKPVEVAKIEIASTTYCVEHPRTLLEIKAYDAAGKPVDAPYGDLDYTTDPPKLADGRAIKTPVRTTLELLGADITVKVAGKGTPLAAEATLKPTYCDEVVLGFDGETGNTGSFGASGGRGPGGPGGPGQTGTDAEPLHIEADTFIGPDKQRLLLVAFASDQGELKLLTVHDPAKGPIQVSANGGSGGSGGMGGNAGDCQRGGDGGTGGTGGRGADITLVLGDAALEQAISVSMRGGNGGNIGSGVSGGLNSSTCNTGVGEHGRNGEMGQAGQPGRLKVTVKKKPPLIQQALTTCARCPTK